MFKTAIRFMLYDKPKTIGALFGVVIAIFLIGQQTGIFLFLTGAMSALADNTRTDLWIVDERTTNVNALGLLDTRFGNELASFAGVKKVYPFLVAGGSAKFANGKTYGVQLVGSQAPYFVGGPWNMIQGSYENLLNEGAVSADYFDRKNLGDAQYGEYFEINGKKVFIAAQTRGARGFGAVYLFTTIERARALGRVNPNKVSAFLIELEPNANPEAVRDAINQHLVGVKAWLPKDFARATVINILTSSGIAISTGTLIVFAVISGTVIIGLTLYSAAVDRLKDYATLKAIGATNGYISRLIYTQAIIIALIGYIVGSFLVEGFRNGVAQGGAIFFITPTLRVVFLVLTLSIATFGAYFAIRRITQTEPASVFRA
ncbi:MAG: FtsX-like permease family protein [Cytophagales bacterium]|nr:MAG: FtsX-like permease family protein [Cytophagales bacterium]